MILVWTTPTFVGCKWEGTENPKEEERMTMKENNQTSPSPAFS